MAARRTLIASALAGLLLTALMVAAHAGITAAIVEQKLREKIAERWTTENLVVKVVPYSSQARTDKGQFAQIYLSASAARRRDKHIRVVDLMIDARDVDLDLNALMHENDVTIQSRKLGSCAVKLLLADVNRLLAMKKTPIENLRCEFGNGNITFLGKLVFNIKLTGSLWIKDGYEIHFKPTQASIGILGVPIGIVNRFLAHLNPIINMREVPLQPKIKKIKITPKQIEVTG